MPTLGLDFESYSAVDLPSCGLYRYMDDPSFEPLLLAWALDDEPVSLIDFTKGETLPKRLNDLLLDPHVTKCAFNSQFEMNILHTMGIPVNPDHWIDTQIMASYLGLPRHLAGVGAAIKLPEDQQKMKEGKALIQYFCKPCSPTKTNGRRTRNLPEHAPEKWAVFCEYCKRDVETERTIRKRLEAYPVPENEWKHWRLDVRMNQRGVRVDTQMAQQAVQMATEQNVRLLQEAKDISHLNNPNSVTQLKEWLEMEDGSSLNKKSIASMLKDETDADRKRMLEIRQELGLTSIKKYEAILRTACSDDRVRGCMQFYKAHTGRWSSTLLQLQNLKQNHLDDLDRARRLVKEGDAEGIRLFYGSINDTLSQLIRTAIIPAPGHLFAVADYSAIEARIVAYLADEKWVMESFHAGHDIYCETASRMFGVPVEKGGVNGHLRQKGKQAVLGCSYGGGPGALINMGALENGLTEEELPGIVSQWRTANAKIVEFWWDTDNAAKWAIKHPGKKLPGPHGISYLKDGPFLIISLPSGRSLYYPKAHMTKNRFGGDGIAYQSNEPDKKGEVETYGGPLVENLCQSVARDCLADAMELIVRRNMNIVMTIHDEVVVEVPEDSAEECLNQILRIMAAPIPWAPGLELKGAGYITPYYRKD